VIKKLITRKLYLTVKSLTFSVTGRQPKRPNESILVSWHGLNQTLCYATNDLLCSMSPTTST